jgi:pilus assembly protein CpaF
MLQRALEEEETPLTREERRRLVSEIADDVLGFGPIEPFLRDPTVTEIMVNAPDVIYLEREGRIYPAEGRFVDETHLRRVIDKMVGLVGRRIDESSRTSTPGCPTAPGSTR